MNKKFFIKPSIFTKKKIYNNIPLNKNKKIIGPIRYFPPATKEWYNSIYAFNKNSIKNLTVANNNLSNIIKSYFNFYFNRKVLSSKKLATRFRRLAMKKIFISKTEIKHTTKKVIITLYIYNEERRILIRKIERLEKLLFPFQFKDNFKNKPLSINEKLNLIDSKENNTLFTIKLNKILPLILKQIKIYQKRILLKKESRNYLRELNLIFQLKKYYKNIIKILKVCKNNTTFFKYYEKVYYEAKYKIILEKEIKRIVYYKLLLNLNKSKFEDNFLLKLKSLISKIFQKEVEFNIVNLKTMMLDSNILTQAIALKIQNRNNKLLRVLTRSLDMIMLPLRILSREKYSRINVNELYFNKCKNAKSLNLVYLKRLDNILNNFNTNARKDKDSLNEMLFLFNNFNFFSTPNNIIMENKRTLLNIILKTIKYKKIAGVRLEAKGRLTRRLTASRSVFKIKWKGTLKNLDSSYRELSSVMLRGHIRSNLQYSIVNSKTRNGAFGIKGWISGK
jgi:ribosomal VAR1-like protein